MKNKPMPDKQVFVWRDGQGVCHDISLMDTDHIFNTVCMIWNNARPKVATRPDFKQYSFPSHSPDYLAAAFRELSLELLNRKEDLSGYQRDKLDFILETANKGVNQ